MDSRRRGPIWVATVQCDSCASFRSAFRVQVLASRMGRTVMDKIESLRLLKL